MTTHRPRWGERRRNAAALLVLACSGLPATPAVAQAPLRDSTQRVSVQGLSFLPPSGDGWVIYQRANRSANILLGRMAGGRTHSEVVQASSEYAPVAITSLDSLRSAVSRRLATAAKDQRLSPSEFTLETDTTTAPLCIRYRYHGEDRKVPGHKGELFTLAGSGLVISHPDGNRYLIQVDVSERSGPHDPAADCRAGDRVLASAQTIRPDATLTTATEVGLDPDAIVFAHGSLWIAKYFYGQDGAASELDGELVRVDPAARQVLARIPTGGESTGITATKDALWVTSLTGKIRKSTGMLLKIDPASSQVTLRVPCGKRPYLCLFDGAWLWVSDLTGSVWRLDPGNGRPAGDAVRDLKRPGSLASCNGLLWVVEEGRNQILSIDPSSGRITGSPVGVGGGAYSLAAGDGALWALCSDLKAVQRIDPRTRLVVATIPIPGPDPNSMLFAHGALWVADFLDGSLHRVDPATNRLVGAAIQVAAEPGRMAATDDALWITDRIAGTARRVQP